MHSTDVENDEDSDSRPQSTRSAGGIRQRRATAKEGGHDENDGVRRLVRRLKTLDVYPKTDDEVLTKTESGGMISLISFILITFLLLSEVSRYLFPTVTHSLQVDTRPSKPISIHFDMTFHALRCSETNIDVMDVSGESQVAAEKNIHRIRLDSEGRVIGVGEYEDHAHDRKSGGDGANPIRDRNAAMQHLLAHMGLAPPGMHTGAGAGVQGDNHEDKRGEGCRVYGELRVNRVAGNMHVALGGAHSHGGQGHGHGEETKENDKSGLALAPSHAGPHGHAHGAHGHSHGAGGTQHIHQFMLQDLTSYNCSHTIHQFYFGDDPPTESGPLDGVSQVIPREGGAATAHMQYFIKVVPTVHLSSSSSSSSPSHDSSKNTTHADAQAHRQRVSEELENARETHQLSVTQHTQRITIQDAFAGGIGGQRIPGVFFVYDLSPFMVRVMTRRPALTSLVTSIFAIVGGVLTVAGIIDALLFHSSRIMRQQQQHAAAHSPEARRPLLRQPNGKSK